MDTKLRMEMYRTGMNDGKEGTSGSLQFQDSGTPRLKYRN